MNLEILITPEGKTKYIASFEEKESHLLFEIVDDFLNATIQNEFIMRLFKIGDPKSDACNMSRNLEASVFMKTMIEGWFPDRKSKREELFKQPKKEILEIFAQVIQINENDPNAQERTNFLMDAILKISEKHLKEKEQK